VYEVRRHIVTVAIDESDAPAFGGVPIRRVQSPAICTSWWPEDAASATPSWPNEPTMIGCQAWSKSRNLPPMSFLSLALVIGTLS